MKSLLMVVVVFALLLSACGESIQSQPAEPTAVQQQAESQQDVVIGLSQSTATPEPEPASEVELDGTINTDFILMDYPTRWSGYRTDDYVIIVPPGEMEESIYVAVGLSVGECDGGTRILLDSVLRCEHQVLDHYFPATEHTQIGDLEAVIFRSTDEEDNFYWTYERYTEVFLVVPIQGKEYVAVVYIKGVPEKHEEYLPAFWQMVETIRSQIG